jgi:hypothetical protein
LRGAGRGGAGEEFLESGCCHVREFIADGLSGRAGIECGGCWFWLT